jgi:hypothetical protein
MSQTRVSANAAQTSSEVALQQIGDDSARVSVKMGWQAARYCPRYLYELVSYMAPVKVQQSGGGATEAAGFG